MWGGCVKDDEAGVNDASRPNQAAGVDYRVRRSLRARNVHLKVSARDGLTVVVPTHFDLRRIPVIIEGKKEWIERHLRRFKGTSAAVPAKPIAVLPDRIDLPALGESWGVEYQPAKTRAVGVIVAGPGRITVYGAVHDRVACREALIGWLRLRTREELIPWLVRLSQGDGLPFNEALVRGQKTRWASCSSTKTISLSYKLLFLERDWVRFVLLHELCHTVQMNHSRKFWLLMNRLEPGCGTIRRQMRDAWKKVPDWVEDRE